MVAGALLQSLPDIDFVAAFFLSPTENLLAHRGITHSLFFLLLASVLLAVVAMKIFPGKLLWRQWIFFIGLEIGMHLFIDTMNNYGTGLLEPFSSERFSLHILYVADPFFSAWPVIAMIGLLILRTSDRRRRAWVNVPLVICSMYLLVAVMIKMQVEKRFTRELMEKGLAYQRKLTTPAPFSTMLWFVTAGGKDGYYVGYRSAFQKDAMAGLQYVHTNDSLLTTVRDRAALENLKKFSNGFYTVAKWGDTVVFNDLRFGQVVGWHDPNEKFAFYYYLDRPDKDNRMVVQRGRFEGWNPSSFRSYINRIKSN
jgi:inner membrane protein